MRRLGRHQRGIACPAPGISGRQAQRHPIAEPGVDAAEGRETTRATMA